MLLEPLIIDAELPERRLASPTERTTILLDGQLTAVDRRVIHVHEH